MFNPLTLALAPVLAAWNGPGWWIVFVPLVWFLVILTAILVLRRFVFRDRAAGWGCAGRPRFGGPPSADDVLRRRFAEGDLSEEDYRRHRAVLEEPRDG